MRKPNINAQTQGTLALTRGGTGADLSDTGPGVLVQDTAGAAVSVRSLADQLEALLGESTDAAAALSSLVELASTIAAGRSVVGDGAGGYTEGGINMEYITTLRGTFGGALATIATSSALAAGRYLLEIEGYTAATSFQLAYRINSGSDVGLSATSGFAIGNRSISAEVTLSAGDTLSLRCSNNSSAGTGEASLKIWRIL